MTRIEAGSSAPAAGGDITRVRAAAKKTSIREFLLKYPPPTDVQRTLAVGYFLETHAGVASFTKADLAKGYRDAKETPRPTST